MDAPPEDPRKRPTDDGGWFTWLTALFASDTAKAHQAGDGGESMHHDSGGHDGGGDSGGDGGGDGGGGGD